MIRALQPKIVLPAENMMDYQQMIMAFAAKNLNKYRLSTSVVTEVIRSQNCLYVEMIRASAGKLYQKVPRSTQFNGICIKLAEKE